MKSQMLERLRTIVAEARELGSGAEPIELPPEDKLEAWWRVTVATILYRSSKYLNSTEVLLRSEHEDNASAMVVTRTAFEIAARVAYISKDVEGRLWDYLKHGGVPVTSEDVASLSEELKALHLGGQTANPLFPRRPWKGLKSICAELGDPWAGMYKRHPGDFYSLVSSVAHGSASTLLSDYFERYGYREPTDAEKAATLHTALWCHLQIATIAATVFPQCISMQAVSRMQDASRMVGQGITPALLAQSNLRHTPP